MLIYDPYDEDGNYGNPKPYFVVKEEDYHVLECDGGPRFSGNHAILEIELCDPYDD